MGLKISFREQSKLSVDQINSLIVDIADLEDYLFLNKLEKSLIDKHGSHFLLDNSNYIRLIIAYVLQGDSLGLYELYSSLFSTYMSGVNNDIDKANGFNIYFSVLTHVSLKILRYYKNASEEGSV